MTVDEWEEYFIWKFTDHGATSVRLAIYPELTDLSEEETADLTKRLWALGIAWYDGSRGGHAVLTTDEVMVTGVGYLQNLKKTT